MKLKKLIIINGNSEVEATIKKVVKDDHYWVFNVSVQNKHSKNDGQEG